MALACLWVVGVLVFDFSWHQSHASLLDDVFLAALTVVVVAPAAYVMRSTWSFYKQPCIVYLKPGLVLLALSLAGVLFYQLAQQPAEVLVNLIMPVAIGLAWPLVYFSWRAFKWLLRHGGWPR